MIVLKLLINLTIFGGFLWLVYSVFYFRLMPKLIRLYRRVVWRGKQYDQNIEDIRNERDR